MMRRYGVRTIFFGDQEFLENIEFKYKKIEKMENQLMEFEKIPDRYGARNNGQNKLHAKIEKERCEISKIRTKALCGTLEEISRSWDRWWDGWIWSPRVREVSFSTVDQTQKFVKNLNDPKDSVSKWATEYLKPQYELNYDTTSRHFLTHGGPPWALQGALNQWEEICRELEPRNRAPSVPLLIVEGKRGSGRGDLIEALIRDTSCTQKLLDSFGYRGKSEQGLVWSFVGSTHFSSEFMSIADAVAEFLERFASGTHSGDTAQTIHSRSTTGRSPGENGERDDTKSWHTRLEGALTLLNTSTKNGSNPEFPGTDKPRTALIAISGVQRLVDQFGNFASRDLAKFFGILVKASVETMGMNDRITLVLIGRSRSWNDKTIEQLENEIGITHEKKLEKEYTQRCRLSNKTLQRVWKEPSPHFFEFGVEILELARRANYHKYSFVVLDLLFQEWQSKDLSIPEQKNKKDRRNLVKSLTREINRRGLTHQAEIIVARVIDQWTNFFIEDRGSTQSSELVQSIVGVLSLCPSPIDKGTLWLLVSRELNHQPSNGGNDLCSSFDRVLCLLVSGLIVYKFFPRRRHRESKPPENFYRYSVHSSVRQMTKLRMGHQALPFADPGYFEFSAPESSGVGLPALTADAVNYVYSHVNVLLSGDPLDDTSENPQPSSSNESQNGPTATPTVITSARDRNETKLRCGIHLLRSNLPLVQVLRLEGIPPSLTSLGDSSARLDQHRNLIVRYLNGVRLNSGLPYREFFDLTDSQVEWLNDFPGALHTDELIWLYNELAVICRWQGDLTDSRSILAQTESIRQAAQGDCDSDARIHLLVQSAAVELEMGNVTGAISRLERARAAVSGTDSILEWRAKAYLAVADHLRGEFELAEERYKGVLKYCRTNGRLRSLSFFNRFLGDLRRRRGREDEAARCYEDALAAAAAHPDLFHHTRVAQATLLVKSPRNDPALAAKYLDSALNYAREAGMPRIESDVAAVRAEVRLLQGELDGAGAAAREAIAISSRRGMRLRVIANFVRLGRIQALRGDRVNARMILEDAYRRARGMLYVTMARDAHEALVNVDA